MNQRKIIPMPLPGTDTPDVQPWEREHAAVARKAAAESFVLLKNEGNALPLAKGSRIALFGVGAVETIKGGTGSGDVNERYSVSVAQGLREAGYVLTSESWLAGAEKAYREARLAWKNEILEAAQGDLRHFFGYYASHPFAVPAGDPIPEDAGGADAAVYVISRIAGEGADRDAGPGDYLLTEAEETAIRTLCRLYNNVILLLNVGNPKQENLEEVLVHELMHIKLYPLDQVTEALIVSHYPEGSPARDFAYRQFFCALEQTVEELAKCFLLEFGENRELSFGRCRGMKSFDELYQGLNNIE